MERLDVFKELLSDYEMKLRSAKISVVDAQLIQAQAVKLLLSFEDIVKSRDKWREKYEALRLATKDLKS